MSTHAFVKLSRSLVQDLGDRLGLGPEHVTVNVVDLDGLDTYTTLAQHIQNDKQDLVAPPRLPDYLVVTIVVLEKVKLTLSMVSDVRYLFAQAKCSKSVDWVQLKPSTDIVWVAQIMRVIYHLLSERGVRYLALGSGAGFVPTVYSAEVEILK